MESKQVIVRFVKNSDLPAVKNLIRQSFMAMVAYFPNKEDAVKRVEEKVQEVYNTDLLDVEEYYNEKRDRYFWVAEVDSTVVGTIAMERTGIDAEIHRLSVDETARKLGIGRKLQDTLEEFARNIHKTQTHALPIGKLYLYTGNPESAKFYERVGYYNVLPEKLPDVSFRVFKFVKYLHEVPMKKVTVVGGTHGNELIGGYLVKTYKTEPRKSFQVEYLLANEQAFSKNTRYIDEDLNRCFNISKLEKSSTKTEKTCEEKIALSMSTQLGPKSQRVGSKCATDFIIDIHSSTSNMGVCLMTQSQDSTALRVAHYVKTNVMKEINVYVWKESKTEGYSVDSISPSGLAIEVGPIAHGTLNSELYFKVTKVLEGIFDALEHMNTKADLFNTLTNTEKLNPKNFYGLGTTLPIYENFKTVDFPRNPQGEIIAMVHPERNGKDWMEVKKGDPLFLGFQQEKVYPLEEESSLVAIFINEAAYYEKKQAMRFVKPSMHFVM